MWRKRYDKRRAIGSKQLELKPLGRVLYCDCVDLVLREISRSHLGNDVADDVRVAVAAKLDLEWNFMLELTFKGSK